MGCDIHPIIQVRRDGHWFTEPDVPGALHNRNYDAFAVLANVRNGRGFAGVETGEGFKPISDCRGLPEDLRELTDEDDKYHLPCIKHSRKQIISLGTVALTAGGDNADESRWDCPNCVYLGDHSLTWVTLRELLDYPWAESTRHYGVIPARDEDRGRDSGTYYEMWKPQPGREGSIPSNYSGGISGYGIETWSVDEYESRKAAGTIPSSLRIYVRVSWLEMNSVAVGSLYNEIISVLQTLGAPEDVRIVMGFDS